MNDISWATHDPTTEITFDEYQDFFAEAPCPTKHPVKGPKLAGRAAIITGSSMGFGAAVAERFLTEGANVMLCAREGEQMDRQHRILQAMFPDAEIDAMVADVSRQPSVDYLFDRALERFGTLQIVVNNAGVYGPMGALDEVDWNHWVQAININLMGAVYCSRRAVKHFKERGYGKIINLSGGGATNPLPGLTAYAASKAALVRFTETLAMEVRQSSIDTNVMIDINSVAPGPMATRLADQVIAAGPDAVGQMLYENTVALKTGGYTPPEKGAALCAYLASAESDGITGKLIAANWDPWPFTDDVRAKLDRSDLYTLRRIVPETKR